MKMNIFILSLFPKVCAKWHIDVHVRKMIIEYAQLLSTTHRVLGEVDESLGFYRKTHMNHPCAKWARMSSMNYCFLYELFVALCDEYTYRFGKVHLTDKKLRNILRIVPANIPQGPLTTFPQAMPEQYKTGNVCEAYQLFYRGSKQTNKAGKPMDRWTRRDIPEFMEKQLNCNQ